MGRSTDLKHFGVLGMHWGVRKQPNTSGRQVHYSAHARSQVKSAIEYARIATKTPGTKDVHHMSDNELDNELTELSKKWSDNHHLGYSTRGLDKVMAKKVKNIRYKEHNDMYNRAMIASLAITAASYGGIALLINKSRIEREFRYASAGVKVATRLTKSLPEYTGVIIDAKWKK